MAAILITGGCGFIGRHLARRLVAGGHDVTLLDDLSSSAGDAADGRLVEGDVRDGALLARLVGAADLVYHLAAVASVARSVEDWPGTHSVNAGGTVAVLDAARHRRVPVVYASSAAVYGDQPEGAIAEAATRVPLSAYGVDKLTGEGHAGVAGRLFAVPTIGLRFFNVYGPGQSPSSPYSGVISRFIALAQRGAALPVNGDGGQTRDFIYIDDVVGALIAAAGAAATDAPVVNVCRGEGIAIRALAERINRQTGNAAGLARQPPRAGDIRHSVGDPGAARRLIGFAAGTTFDDGLARTIAWVASAR